eukprot:4472777-Prymnesium_polylepis.5
MMRDISVVTPNGTPSRPSPMMPQTTCPAQDAPIATGVMKTLSNRCVSAPARMFAENVQKNWAPEVMPTHVNVRPLSTK